MAIFDVRNTQENLDILAKLDFTMGVTDVNKCKVLEVATMSKMVFIATSGSPCLTTDQMCAVLLIEDNKTQLAVIKQFLEDNKHGHNKV